MSIDLGPNLSTVFGLSNSSGKLEIIKSSGD
jgi:hypothetical protein